MTTLEKQLEQLREDWKKYPKRRKIIELTAKKLKSMETFADVIKKELF